MQLRKFVLGLASVAMLASCGAKQITKAEAVKIAQDHYDSSNQVYKAGKYKLVIDVRYSDNTPEEARTKQGSTEEGNITGAEEIARYRVSSAMVAAADETYTTFKADGNKLEISATHTNSGGTRVYSYVGVKCDEIGYFLEQVDEMKTAVALTSELTYECTIRSTITFTWEK